MTGPSVRPVIVVEVLIGGPSDTDEYRIIATEAIHRWNSLEGHDSGVRLEPTHWSTHVRPALGDRPQGIVNDQLVVRAAAMIAVFKGRLGLDTGQAVSGTAEEIEQFVSTGREVMVYFAGDVFGPGDVGKAETQRLSVFYNDMRARGILSEFSGLVDFKTKIQDHIVSLARALAQKHGPALAVVVRPEFGGDVATVVRRTRNDWMRARAMVGVAAVTEAKTAMTAWTLSIRDVMATRDLSAFPLFESAVLSTQIEASELAGFSIRPSNTAWFWTAGDRWLERVQTVGQALSGQGGPESITIPERLSPLAMRSACIRLDGRGSSTTSDDYVTINVKLWNDGQHEANNLRVTGTYNSNHPLANSEWKVLKPDGGCEVQCRFDRPQLGGRANLSFTLQCNLVLEFDDGRGPQRGELNFQLHGVPIKVTLTALPPVAYCTDGCEYLLG